MITINLEKDPGVVRSFATLIASLNVAARNAIVVVDAQTRKELGRKVDMGEARIRELVETVSQLKGTISRLEAELESRPASLRGILRRRLGG